MNPDRDQLNDLITAHLDGNLSEARRSTLNSLLQSTPEAREYFIRAMRQETLLGEVLRDAEAVPKSVTPRPARFSWLKTGSLVAAGVLLVAGMLFWFKASPRQSVAILAIQSGTAEITRGTQKLASAEPLQSGDSIKLSEPGACTLTYTDGTFIKLGSGSSLRVSQTPESAKHLHFTAGTLRADVAPQDKSKPLVISTPESTVTVIGTEFTVSVQQGETNVHTLHGRVRVARNSNIGKSSAVELTAGQFTSVRADQSELAVLSSQPQKQPAPPEQIRKSVLMIVADPIPFYTHDVVIRSILQELNLDVIERTFDKVSPADLNGISLIVLPSHKCQKTGMFSQTPLPVIAWHNLWHVDLAMSDITPSSSTMKQRTLRLDNAAHKLADGLKNADPVFEWLTYAVAKPSPNATVIIHSADSEGAVVYAYEKGSVMSTLTAPARRVGFSLDVRESSGRAVPSDTGARLLKAAVHWCLEAGE